MRLLVLVASILAVAAPALAGYGAPFDLPGNDSAADPMILEVDGVYYLYVTTGWQSFETWYSPDLDNWDYGGVVFEAGPAGAWNDADLWAPEVHTDGERFFLYYTANMMIGVAVSDSPLGPFVAALDHPFVGGGYGGVNGWAIDGHVFVDDDGRRFFYYAGYTPFSAVRGLEMNGMTQLRLERHPILIETGIFNWEVFVVEAPWMVKHDDTYYLMYSGGGANVPIYAVGYATADDPLGPFTEFVGNPILHHDDQAGIYGPGHNCAITGPDNTLQIVYHSKKEVTVGWDREIRRNRLCFTDGERMYVGVNGCTETDDPVDDDDDDDNDDNDDDDEAGCGG